MLTLYGCHLCARSLGIAAKIAGLTQIKPGRGSANTLGCTWTVANARQCSPCSNLYPETIFPGYPSPRGPGPSGLWRFHTFVEYFAVNISDRRIRVASANAVKGWSALVIAWPVLWGCAQAPPPMPVPQAPKAVVSYVNIPIAIELDAIEKAAETALQRSIGVQPFQQALNGGSNAPSCGEDVGYSIERGPIALSGAGTVLTTTLDLSYWLKAR